jgi:hypothetical protein
MTTAFLASTLRKRMKTLAQAVKWQMQKLSCCFALLAACALPITIAAQTPAAQASAPAATTSAAAAAPAPASVPVHGIISLDGPWRFHTGDDPAWAEPAFDDSSWTPVILGSALADQGIENYSGYAWYRLHLTPQQLTQAGGIPLEILVAGNSVGQLAAYVNGYESGHTVGMTDRPVMYQSPPFVVTITQPTPDGGLVIAVRTWASAQIGYGLLDKVQVGSHAEISDRLELSVARRWGKSALSGIIASFLFLCVAALAATLYLAQRSHSEYLWLALLCFAVTLQGLGEAALGLGLISLPASGYIQPWLIWFFIATTLEFVLRFTGYNLPRLVRGMQLGTLLLPLASLVNLQQTFNVLSLITQLLFCVLIVYLLFRAWRRGRPEAGVMLIPFFLAATADSSNFLLQYAASHYGLSSSIAGYRFHFGPVEYSTGTVSYLIFLGSLVSVILYRFIHVSQEEQRSAAEIEAARSVQALLIPTQLPSNQNFILEGAYLPANGVGGDFFQVLTLKDDSLLLVVGDVSGKGLRAAMNASTLVGALRNEISHDPATVLNHLNQVMLGATSGTGANTVAGFATCLCARIHPDGRMTIANAGHLSPYRDGRELELAADLPLGIVAHIAYEQVDFQLSPGDRLIFLSDGVVEATNAQGELFGFERTQQVSHESARYISQTAQRFGQNDDITVVSLYFVKSTVHRVESEPVRHR